MTASPNNESGLSLPRPIEQAPAANGGVEAGSVAAEQAPIQAEQAPIVAQAAPPLTAPMPTSLPPLPASDAQQADVTSTTQISTTDIPDDGDLIEKEWVTKAKQIVERNRDDPYKQSEELTVFKADYMKKRYDKTIKVSK